MFGRRSILITGFAIRAVALFFCGLFTFKGWDLEAFIMLCLFIGTSEMTQGSIGFLYISEVTVDAASGFSMFARYLHMMLVAFTFEFVINSPLQIYGTFWYFSGMTFLGFLFCVFFVRETRGLTDIEKKMLYSPGSILSEQIMEL